MMLETTIARAALLGATALFAFTLGCDSGSDSAADGKGTPTASATKTDSVKPTEAPGRAIAPSDDADAGESLEGFDPKVVQAATLARDIEAKPDNADQILASAELDRSALDALMVEIAKDPALTEQYRVARGL